MENMDILIAERESRYKEKADEENRPLKMKKTYELMARKRKREYRLQSRSCNIVSLHPIVLEADEKAEKLMNNPSHMLDIKLEMSKCLKTQY